MACDSIRRACMSAAAAESFLRASDHHVDECGMTFERAGDFDIQITIDAPKVVYDGGKITAEVNPQSQEERDHDDSGGAFGTDLAHGFAKIGLPQFQKRGLDGWKI